MIMRKYYISFIAMAMLATGCTEEESPYKGFESDATSIEAVAAEGGEHSIVIRSENEWTAQSDAPWIMISPANGRGEVKCIIKVDSTLLNESRTSRIRFVSEGKILREIDVTQLGFERSITPIKDIVEIESYARRDDRWVEVEISTNVEFKATTDAKWLKVNDYSLNLDRGARPRTTRLRLNWDMNSDPETREATIELTPKEGDQLSAPSRIKIRQQAGPLIEDNRAGDSLAIVTIYNKMECWAENVISDKLPMDKWECLRLWDADDESLPCPEAIGRVRDLDLSYFNTEDGIPAEVKHLKYIETLSLYGNVNTMLKDIDLCPEIATLDYLKALRIGAMGLVSLPKNFTELGDTLELLDLNSNNFEQIPAIINEENFPQLTSLNFTGNRRSSTSDLRRSTSGIGLHINTRDDGTIRRLFLWDKLEELSLSYNYIEGAIPQFRVGEDGIKAYTNEDSRGDTLRWAVENNLPRVLPNMRALRINLNFMTGEIPDWLLYHPNLMEWTADLLVYPQQEKCFDSEGNVAGFTNAPTSTEYYFEAYPLYRSRYEFNDEIE